jgi:hypothetical protein
LEGAILLLRIQINWAIFFPVPNSADIRIFFLPSEHEKNWQIHDHDPHALSSWMFLDFQLLAGSLPSVSLCVLS